MKLGKRLATIVLALLVASCRHFPGIDLDNAIEIPVNGAAVTGIFNGGGVAYRFTAVAATRYIIETSGSSDTVLTLLDANESELLSDDDSGESLNARIEWTAPSGGVYFVVVEPFAGGSGPFGISVRSVGGTTNAGPTAAFIGEPSSGVAPLLVRFRDLSSQGDAPITARSWDFGDGATSSEFGPQHTFAAGTWTVRLTVTTSLGSNSTTRTITATSSTAPNSTAETTLNAELARILPSGAFQLPANVQVDETVLVGGASGKALDEYLAALDKTAFPGSTVPVVLPFQAPNANVTGIGIRFGTNGPRWVVPQPNVASQSSGVLSTSLNITPELCAKLSEICHDVRCYEFAVTSAGRISRDNVQDLAMACGNCDEPSCRSLITECSVEEGDVTVWNSFGEGGNIALTIDGQPAGSFTQFYESNGPSCGTNNGAAITQSVIAGRQHAYEAIADGGQRWAGAFTVPANGCARVQLGAPNGGGGGGGGGGGDGDPLTAQNILGVWDFTSGDIAGHEVTFKSGGQVEMVGPDGSDYVGTWSLTSGGTQLTMQAQKVGAGNCRKYTGSISGGRSNRFTTDGRCEIIISNQGCDFPQYGTFRGDCTLNFVRKTTGGGGGSCDTNAPGLAGSVWTSTPFQTCIRYNSDGTGTINFFSSTFANGPRTRRFTWCLIPNGPQKLVVHAASDGLGPIDPQIAAIPWDPATQKLGFGFTRGSTGGCNL